MWEFYRGVAIGMLVALWLMKGAGMVGVGGSIGLSLFWDWFWFVVSFLLCLTVVGIMLVVGLVDINMALS